MIPPFGSSPLIAASAAARLVQSILARISTPHALPTARPLSGTALWRQVARRLGYSVDRPGPLLSDRSHASGVAHEGRQPSVPPVSFVWHTRAVASRNADDGAANDWPTYSRPASPSRQSFQFVGQPVPVPVTPAPAHVQRHSGSTSPAPAPPSQTESGPPSFVPATRILIDYVASPIGRNSEPVTLNPELIRGSRFTPQYPAALAFEMNRDLVPATDLLSRMVRTPQIDLKPAQSRTGTTPVEALALPEAQSPLMPLAARPARPVVASQSDDPSYAPVPSTRGALGRLVDHVISAVPIPEPIRRAMHLEHTHAPSIQPSPSLTQPPEGSTLEQVASGIVSQDLQIAPQQPVPAEHEPPVKDIPAPMTPLPVSAAASEAGVDVSVSPATEPQTVHSEITPEAISGQPVQRQVSRGREGLLGTLVGRLLGGSETGAGRANPTPLRMPWARPVPQQPASSAEVIPESEVGSQASVIAPASAAQSQQIDSRPVLAKQDVPAQTTTVPVPLIMQVADASGTQTVRTVDLPPASPLNISPDVVLPLPGAIAPAVQAVVEATSSGDLGQTGVAGEAQRDALPARAWEEMPGIASELASEHAPLVETARPLAYQGSLVRRIMGRIGGRLGGGLGEGAFRAMGTPLFAAFESSVQPTPFASPQRSAPAGPGNLSPALAATGVGTGGQWEMSQPGSQPTIAFASGVPGHGYAPEAIQSRSLPTASILSRIPSFAAVFRSRNLLAPALADLPSSLYESDGGADNIDDYMAALEQLYGRETSTSGMPLAVPFGTYASPTERPSYFAPDRPLEGVDRRFEPRGSASFDDSDRYSLQNAPSIDALAPVSVSGHEAGAVGQITDYSWGDASDEGMYTPEADAWAGVVAAGVGSGHSTGSPALALAGAETSPDTGPQRPPNEDKVVSPGLEDLADTVYSLIRERLAIEKERTFT